MMFNKDDSNSGGETLCRSCVFRAFDGYCIHDGMYHHKVYAKIIRSIRAMIIKQKYKPDTDEFLSWDELKVSDVFCHMFTLDFCMKTSKNSYISFRDKKYYTISKLLQGSHSKVYYQINAEFIFSDEPITKSCENCDLYFKAMTKEEMRKGDVE